ncbi:MAG: hypothetical protein R3C16_13610 [Hyphomonadaceae bacterium]
MPSGLFVFLLAALLTAAAGFWALRAYRREGASSPVPALTAVGLVGIAALTAYLVIGRPELPNQPFAGRLDAVMQRPLQSWTPDEFLAVQAARARENPDDPLPLFFSGEVLMRLDRPQEAARAYDMALRREPRLAEAMMGLGRAIVRIEGGVTPEARQLFEQASELMTDDPAPWIYQALAATQENREADARRFWGEALARMSPDDPRREMAQRMSTEGS